MRTIVTNFGNKLGVQLPKSLLQRAKIAENDNVEIFVKNNNIIIRQQENKKHLTTKERINAFCETTDEIQSPEIDWGKPKGKEIW